jgi:threonine aldolase
MSSFHRRDSSPPENTHNRGGGVVFPQDDAVAICAMADAAGVATFLDGARLFNAAIASGKTVAELARPFRMAWIALSKGLGCPLGSVVVGTTADIAAARRVRRMFGGALRQAGILAAAGLYTLDHNIDRLREDHDNARILAETLAGAPGIELDLATVQTNIALFHLAKSQFALIAADAYRSAYTSALYADQDWHGAFDHAQIYAIKNRDWYIESKFYDSYIKKHPKPTEPNLYNMTGG